MTSPYAAMPYCPEHTFPRRLREPAATCLSWAESSFLASMAQSQSSQTSEILGQDVFNQLLEMLDQSAFHSVQPIELNFSESPVSGSPSNTIQISMDCITMHESEEPCAVREAGRESEDLHTVREGISGALRCEGGREGVGAS
ncbi:hypothetical protein AALO_G00121470 [Alosa alosa]|uniref:Uncharacterized protein n=1 Tax=Alosa alosa TaxID=278164 RepID=A0AAV6GP88_9TELE|nr:hypothetical protein AALO_G00121470 [Alosa alosa]